MTGTPGGQPPEGERTAEVAGEGPEHAGEGSGADGGSRSSGPARERWRSFGAPALAAVTIAALCLGVLLGWLSFGDRAPTDDGADAGFARDMSEHHAQAVQMSQLVMQRTDDEATRRLATDISNNQNSERGMMATWLMDWGLPRARAGEPMEWMSMGGMGMDDMAGGDEAAEESMAGHDMADSTAGEGGDMEGESGMGGQMDLPAGVSMPGMATPTEIQALTDASGQEAEVLFLQLMTTHHLAGVDMAEAALADATQPEVVAAAQRMVNAQTGEIQLMRDMLAERDAEAREDLDAWLAEQDAP